MRFLSNEERRMRIERIWQRSPQVQKTAQAESDGFSLSSRRGFLVGALSLIAAPALVRASSIMPVKAWVEPAVIGVATWDPGHQHSFSVSVVAWVDEAGILNFSCERVAPDFDPMTLCALPYEGRLPEVSAWKSTAGPERVCAFGAASFPLCAPSVVQVSQRELPMLDRGGARHG
jgi:hypothetical protein